MATAPLCGRVGCGEAAICTLLMAAQECEAWLVDLDHESAPEGVALCLEHADRIRVPMGWGLSDERTPAKARKKRAKKPKPPQNPPEQTTEPSEPPTRSERPAPSAKPDAGPARPGAEHAEGTEDVAESADGDAGAEPDELDSRAEGDGDEAPSLQVFEGGDDPSDTTVFHEDGQGALWDTSTSTELEADDSTPLLKRAFRVVRDD